MKRYLLSAILLLFLPELKAQEAQKKFNLKDCITYGLANHRSVTIYKNESTAANAAAREALSAYLPSINVNAGIDDNIKVQEQVIPAGLLGDQDVRVAFTKQFNTTATAQLDQTLYDQSLIIGLRARKHQKQKAALGELQNQEQLIYDISVAYYQVIVYTEQLEFLQRNSESYAEQVRISTLQVTKGVLAEVELNKVRVNYNNTLSQIRLAQSNLELSINELKNTMGYSIDQPLTVDTQGNLPEPELEDTYATGAFNAASRTDYQLAETNSMLLKIDYQRIRATNFPKLTFYAKYGGIGFGDDLDESFNTIADFSTIGIKLSAPLFDGFKRKSKAAQAEVEYLNAIENLKLDASKYRMEAENAKTKLVKAQSSISQERENITLAESVFKATDLQFQKGVTSLTDWLNAQFSLKEAQNNYLNSTVDYYLATLELEKANGTLRDYYNTLNK